MSLRKAAERRISFALAPDDCSALVAALGAAGAHWTAQTKTLSLYLDTPDNAIGECGFGFGIRRRGDVTLNDMPAALRRFARGLPQQNGWSTFRHALSSAAPPEAGRLQSLLGGGGRRQLRVVFQAETQRSFWSVLFADATAAVTLEQMGVVNGGKHRLALVSLAYPTKLAEPALAFIATLGETVRLRLTGGTLALEAYGRSDHAYVGPSGAILPRLTPDMSSAAAFQAIAHAALTHFLLAQGRLRLLRDAEAVHQCRVALRRLSAAQRLFSKMVAGEGVTAIRRDLRHLKQKLGVARELDVLLEDLGRLAAGPSALSVAPIRALLQTRREEAYDRLITAIDAPQTEAALRRLLAWIDAGDWTCDGAAASRRGEPLAAFVQRKFSSLAEKLQSRCERLERAGHDERHRIRIRAKNLRYSAEFLDRFLRSAGRRSARRHQRAFVTALKHLQTFLGAENDARVAHRYFADLSRGDGLAAADAAALAAGKILASHINASGKRKFHKSAAKARQELSAIKPFWRDLVCK